MEAYKTNCLECGHVRFWVGYKTGLGKTPQQLQQMKDDMITCAQCGSKSAKTVLDRESETGQVFDDMDKEAASMIVEIINQIASKKE